MHHVCRKFCKCKCLGLSKGKKKTTQNLIPLSLVFMGLPTSIFWVSFSFVGDAWRWSEGGGRGVRGFVVLGNLLTMVVQLIILVFSNS